jgi:hypothetical protein
MQIKDFSPHTYAGLSNRKELSKTLNEYRVAFFLYAIACALSIITSSYGSVIGKLYLGIALVILAEALKLIASIGKEVNKAALFLGIAVSVGTASFSSSLFFQLNNQHTENKQQIIDRLEREIDSLKAPSFSSDDLVAVQDINIELTKKANAIKTASYRIKIYKRSRTRTMTGSKIISLKSCGSSDTCNKVKANYEAVMKLLQQNKSKQSLIKTALQSNDQQQARKVELERELLATKRDINTIFIATWIQVLITAALIVVIEFLQILSRIKMAHVKPNLNSLLFHRKIWNIKNKPKNCIKVWLFHKMNHQPKEVVKEVIQKPIRKPKSQKASTVLAKNAPTKKRKKLNSEAAKKIIESLKIKNVKTTKTNILNELSLFGFGKTDVNYKMVRAVIAP